MTESAESAHRGWGGRILVAMLVVMGVVSIGAQWAQNSSVIHRADHLAVIAQQSSHAANANAQAAQKMAAALASLESDNHTILGIAEQFKPDQSAAAQQRIVHCLNNRIDHDVLRVPLDPLCGNP